MTRMRILLINTYQDDDTNQNRSINIFMVGLGISNLSLVYFNVLCFNALRNLAHLIFYRLSL